jgi:hypothetical protein
LLRVLNLQRDLRCHAACTEAWVCRTVKSCSDKPPTLAVTMSAMQSMSCATYSRSLK